MNNIQVIDNFLEETYFQELQFLMLKSENFEWYYNDYVVNTSDKICDHFQFIHIFYDNFIAQSVYFESLYPLIKKLNPTSLIRIKSNLLTKTSSTIEHGYHTDIHNDHCAVKSKTAILYLNTNNGYTKFENGTKIDSVENRIVIFNAKLSHTGSTCTDKKIRAVINLNFFQ